MSLRLETVAAETEEPHRIFETSSIPLVEMPAGYISIMASSMKASRRSTTAAANRIPLSLGILNTTSPDVVVSPRSPCPA